MNGSGKNANADGAHKHARRQRGPRAAAAALILLAVVIGVALLRPWGGLQPAAADASASAGPDAGLHAASAAEPASSMLPLHSHNDYYRDRPLAEALEARSASIEVDVFPGDAALLVAHDREEITPERTIDAMYIAPLRERLDRYGAVYPGQPDDRPVYLLVDFKGHPERSLELLIEATRPIADGLATPDDDGVFRGPLLVVVSGNVPREGILSRTPRDIFVDGRLHDLDPDGLAAAEAPLVSSSWWSTFTWTGTGAMPDGERAELERLVAAAHGQGHDIRFWASPDGPDAWALLLDVGVDLVNTDRPIEAAAFLDEHTGADR